MPPGMPAATGSGSTPTPPRISRSSPPPSSSCSTATPPTPHPCEPPTGGRCGWRSGSSPQRGRPGPSVPTHLDERPPARRVTSDIRGSPKVFLPPPSGGATKRRLRAKRLHNRDTTATSLDSSSRQICPHDGASHDSLVLQL